MKSLRGYSHQPTKLTVFWVALLADTKPLRGYSHATKRALRQARFASIARQKRHPQRIGGERTEPV